MMGAVIYLAQVGLGLGVFWLVNALDNWLIRQEQKAAL